MRVVRSLAGVTQWQAALVRARIAGACEGPTPWVGAPGVGKLTSRAWHRVRACGRADAENGGRPARVALPFPHRGGCESPPPVRLIRGYPAMMCDLDMMVSAFVSAGFVADIRGHDGAPFVFASHDGRAVELSGLDIGI